jgi:hypothetical protein
MWSVVALAFLADAYSGGAELRQAIATPAFEVASDGKTTAPAVLRKQEELRDVDVLGEDNQGLSALGGEDLQLPRTPLEPRADELGGPKIKRLAYTSAYNLAYNTLWRDRRPDGFAEKAVATEAAATPFVSDRDTSSRQFMYMVMISVLEAGVLIAVYMGASDNRADEWSESVREARESADTVPWYTVVICALVYLFLSLGLTVFNKWIFIPEGGNFPFPLTLCLLHLLTTCVALQVVRYVYPSVMPSSHGDESPLKTRPLRVFLNASVPGFFLSTSLAYGNISAVSLSVAYATMLKGAKPAIVFLVCLLFGLEHFERTRFFLVCGLLCGAVLCIMGDTGTSSAWFR